MDDCDGEAFAVIQQAVGGLMPSEAELAQLKNRGAGILIGVALAGGAIGTALTKAWAALFA